MITPVVPFPAGYTVCISRCLQRERGETAVVCCDVTLCPPHSANRPQPPPLPARGRLSFLLSSATKLWNKGAGPRYATHALARADPRAALTARPARSRRFGGKERSTAQRKQRRGRGRRRLTAAAARVHATLCCRSRTPTRARAHEAVGRSFVSSFSRSSRSSGRSPSRCSPGAAARGAAHALLARRRSPYRRRLALAARFTQRYSWRPRYNSQCSRARLCAARPSRRSRSCSPLNAARSA